MALNFWHDTCVLWHPLVPPPGDHVRRKALRALLAGFGLAALTACVDGNPAGPSHTSVAISASPVFTILPTQAELAALDLLRVTLHGAGPAPIVLERKIEASSQAEWAFNLTVEVALARPLSIYLETELIDLEGGAESVEWSGRTSAFQIRATFEPQELRQVDLFRGPLANLGLTSVDFGAAGLALVEGTTSTLRWTLAGDTTGAVMYVRTLDESVASLEERVRVRGQRSGSTKVVVFGGRVADTLDLTVRPINSVSLPPLAQLEATILPQLDYVVSNLFMETFGDAAGASSMRDEMTSLGAALRSRQGQEVIGAFEAAKAVWRSYGKDSRFRRDDGPQLGVIAISLILVANTLQTGLP